MSPRWAPVALLAIVVVAACDLPSSPPEWDTLWAIPLEGTRMSVGSLLPDRVQVSPSGTEFRVELQEASQTRPLGALCSACIALNGQEVPKPLFEGVIEVIELLPSDLESAELISGAVTVRIENGFAFDPLRPAPGVFGRMEIELRDGSASGRLLAVDTVRGAETALPQGESLSRNLTLAPGPVTNGLWGQLRVISPLGAPVLINASEELTFRATSNPLSAARARVRVGGRAVEMESHSLDLADLDPGVVNRIEGGTLRIAVRNGFALAAEFTLRIEGPQTPPILRTIPVGPGSSNLTVTLSGEEIRSMVGVPAVTVSGNGVIPPGTPPETVTPSQEISLGLRLDLSLRLGGS